MICQNSVLVHNSGQANDSMKLAWAVCLAWFDFAYDDIFEWKPDSQDCSGRASCWSQWTNLSHSIFPFSEAHNQLASLVACVLAPRPLICLSFQTFWQACLCLLIFWIPERKKKRERVQIALEWFVIIWVTVWVIWYCSWATKMGNKPVKSKMGYQLLLTIHIPSSQITCIFTWN